MFKIESDGNEGFKFNQIVEDNLREDFLAIVMLSVKKRLVDDVIGTLTPQNFMGEAAEYLQDHSEEINDIAMLECATRILSEFKENLDDLLIYDETTHKILISQSVADFEYGTYYKPLLKLITKSLELSLKG